ncbi:MAG: hypothetical protein KatS3mg076_0404 [Candidatus Binatia bacterium]|nr:MAG: hypothetical protein KatS3mg076_0404 [Candidatus Binatia bacterium]
MGRSPSPRSSEGFRLPIVAVTDRPAYRETLSVLLEPDFRVFAIEPREAPRALAAFRPFSPLVVVAVGDAEATDFRFGRRTFFVEPPPGLATGLDPRRTGRWDDPWELRAKIVRMAEEPRGETEEDAWALYGALFDRDVRAPLCRTSVLARLFGRSRSDLARALCRRFLFEQLVLLRRLVGWATAWPTGPGRIEELDVGELLRAEESGRRRRLVASGVRVVWEDGTPVRVTAPKSELRLAARCLWEHLAAIGPASVGVSFSSGRVEFRFHPPRLRGSPNLLAAEQLFRRVGAEFVADAERWEVRFP